MKSLVLAYIVVPAVAAAAGFTAAQKATETAPSSYLNAVVVSTDVGPLVFKPRETPATPMSILRCMLSMTSPK